ncbi:MAG: flagellar biosynthesis protein FlhF [Miltoncostaeaceae bacterium]|jgi:flagellar biosynthesis GTPase FlhF|nr:flagellar biosynthesis protein FlhF [Miltoncostaeaceae bacterium]
MNADPGTRTFRGGSLDELLPQIREALGPDAVVLRQREGVIGGFRGFFAKRCVEVEARAAAAGEAVAAAPAAEARAIPARSVIDAYDTGEVAGAEMPELPEEMLADAAPFAEHLAKAFRPMRAERDEAPAAAAEEVEGPLEFAGLEEAVAAARAEREVPLSEPVVRRPEPPRRRRAGSDPEMVRAAMVSAGVPRRLADAIMEETASGQPLEPAVSRLELARRALARRVRVSHGWRTPRRTIAIVGPPGSGRTLVVARLCNAYAEHGGTSVAALSLETGRQALRLGMLTEGADVALEVAPSPGLAAEARERLTAVSLVVADTPPLDLGDPEGVAELARLLEALQPDETHLLVPAGSDLEAGRALLFGATQKLAITKLIVARADSAGTGVPIGLSLVARIPVSYVSEGVRPDTGLRAAEPDELARMVLP